MLHFIEALLLFWLKALGLIAIIALGIVFILGFAAKLRGRQQKGVLTIENVTAELDHQERALHAEILPKKEWKAMRKASKKAEKAKKEASPQRLFVLEFKGDMQAHEADNLAETITATLQIAGAEDQVLVKLTSPGGLVQGYGFAAAELNRIRVEGLKLTVAVDQVAASGGYLMAVVADEIIASPFAIIGSIGVVAQMPNFHRFLKEKGIDFEQITAGDYKRTVTVFGKNTPGDRAKLKAQLEDIHEQFKIFIVKYRPEVDLAQIATGEYWLAEQALALKLVDKLQLSDEFILAAYREGYQIYQLKYLRKKSWGGRLGGFLRQAGFNFLADASHIRPTL